MGLSRVRRLGREALLWAPLVLIVVGATFLGGRESGRRDDELGPYSLFRIASRVDGVDGPAVRVGQPLQIIGEVCASAGREVAVEALTYVRRLGDGGTVPPIPYPTAQIVVRRGCERFDRQVRQPDGLEPGSYVLYGVHRVLATGEQESWTTEPFRVVP